MNHRYIPEKVIKYWQSVTALKNDFPEIYTQLVQKKKIKFVEKIKKPRNYALQQKAVIVSKYKNYLDKKTSEANFDKQAFIENTIELKEQEIKKQEQDLEKYAKILSSIAEKFNNNLCQGIANEDECKRIDELLKDFNTKMCKRYRVELSGNSFVNDLLYKYKVNGLRKLEYSLIDRYNKSDNESFYKMSTKWVNEHKRTIDLMNGIRKQVNIFNTNLFSWLSHGETVDRAKCEEFEGLLLRTLEQYEKINNINNYKMEEAFLNSEFITYGISLNKIVLDFLAKRHCRKDKNISLYDTVYKNVVAVRRKAVNDLKSKLNFDKDFDKKIEQPILPPRSGTFEISTDKIVNKLISNNNVQKKYTRRQKNTTKSRRCKSKKFVANCVIVNDNKQNNEKSSNEELHTNVQNESFWEKIKRIFSCCNYDLNNKNEIIFDINSK